MSKVQPFPGAFMWGQYHSGPRGLLYLSYVVLLPETGIVEGRVPVLIDCIDVGLIVKKLQI